jgi:hypothetical protein
MTWTLTNLIVQVVTGLLGAHITALVVKEHSFGFMGHTLVGALAGAVSGFFLQTSVITMVTASGSLNEPTAVENAVLQSFAGLAAGGCLMLIVGFARHGIAEHKSQRNPGG